MTQLAADISSHNTITSWPAFLASVDIVIVKITQAAGVAGYVWDGATAALAQGRAAGKCIGAYHFYGGGDPVAEADFFLAHYDWRPGEVPIIDWEPAAPPPDPDGWCAVFGQRLLDRIHVGPMAYMNSSTARSNSWTRTRAQGTKLWVAQYGANNGQPGAAPAVGSWGSYAAWQYTSAGTRPGVSGLIDLSLFYGTAAQWRAYGTPGGTDMPLTDADVAKLLDWAVRQPDGGTRTLSQMIAHDTEEQARLARVETAVSELAVGTAPTVDVVALAAALLADDAAVKKLGDAIAAGLAGRVANG